MLNIIDLGEKWGFPVGRIFDPWKAITLPCDTLSFLKEHSSKIDLVCFGGGHDIHPSLYGHRNVSTDCGDSPSNRDLWEIGAWEICRDNKIPVLGICRGAQFVCAMSGGSLIQDIGGGHGKKGHILKTDSGEDVAMTSTHHQLMWPRKTKHKLIAWLEGNGDNWLYDHKRLGDLREETKEPEIVFFPETISLAVQGHPEYYRDLECRSVSYIRELVGEYLFPDNSRRLYRGQNGTHL